ncbi:hypothetical protein B296_00043013 [Ensete ventricosum]|uniref:Uncharacterized protein n=1 Tax=Ensete ventricosum TaxID=4639 RepID=A0A426YEQ3_ENSVE|nr:hypothetical protein B296_00043013 [Ensete ventricosum]
MTCIDGTVSVGHRRGESKGEVARVVLGEFKPSARLTSPQRSRRKGGGRMAESSSRRDRRGWDGGGGRGDEWSYLKARGLERASCCRRRGEGGYDGAMPCRCRGMLESVTEHDGLRAPPTCRQLLPIAASVAPSVVPAVGVAPTSHLIPFFFSIDEI